MTAVSRILVICSILNVCIYVGLTIPLTECFRMPWRLVFTILLVRREVFWLGLTCIVAAESANQTSGLPLDPYVHTIGVLEIELNCWRFVCLVSMGIGLLGHPLLTNIALTWPEPVFNSTSVGCQFGNTIFLGLAWSGESLSPAHSVMRREITIFGSRTPAKYLWRDPMRVSAWIRRSLWQTGIRDVYS